MNNKIKGTMFEREVCKILAENGYWVHFMSPDATGAQPFDIIAVKDGYALAADCKTCDANSFTMNRLEQNQIMAFDRWMACGNTIPVLFVKHEEEIFMIPYDDLVKNWKVKLNANYRWGKNQD